jgi:hypothetical protein
MADPTWSCAASAAAGALALISLAADFTIMELLLLLLP